MSDPDGVDTLVFEELAKSIEEQEAIDTEILKFSHEKLRGLFTRRRELIKTIPSFWSVAIMSSGILTDYVNYEDAEVLEHLQDLHVEWDKDHPHNFEITFSFANDNPFLASTTLAKKFVYRKLDKGLYKYVSDPVPLKWKARDLTKPKPPAKSGQADDENFDDDDDDESFFKWFSFSGEGPGDYRDGEVVAQALADDIFPHAIKFYVDGINDDLGDDEYSIDDEDIEEDDEEEEEDEDDGKEPAQKKQKN